MGGTQSSQQQHPQTPAPPYQATGLYSSCDWDAKSIKKFVLNKKLAPLYVGIDKDMISNDSSGTAAATSLEECPICFLFYPVLNRSVCCKKGICTECFLQIKKPSGSATCPFCNRSGFGVVYSESVAKEERRKEIEEQQRVIELKIHMEKEEREQDKQRELQRKERNSSSVTTTTSGSTNLPTQSHSQSLPKSLSIPSNSNLAREDKVSTSYPSREAKATLELEELMIMEAIRLSLQTNGSEEDQAVTLQNNTSIQPNRLLETQENTNADSEDEELQRAIRLSLSLQVERVPNER